MGSRVKLLTGYWALGGGILSQLEFNMLERYLRRKLGTKNTDAQSVERIARVMAQLCRLYHRSGHGLGSGRLSTGT